MVTGAAAYRQPGDLPHIHGYGLFGDTPTAALVVSHGGIDAHC